VFPAPVVKVVAEIVPTIVLVPPVVIPEPAPEPINVLFEAVV